ncbi:MAG: hypothetical protein ACIAQZ_02325 [Sedimentisphaeraceae bacterium JB056]
MKKKSILVCALFLAAILAGGCSYDVVTTRHLEQVPFRCVYVEPVDAPNVQMGKVLSDVIMKEMIRKEIAICERDAATVIITGSAFMTTQSKSNQNFLGGSGCTNEAIESVSLIAEDKDGKILASASYDNKDRKSASNLARELGSVLAEKLR